MHKWWRQHLIEERHFLLLNHWLLRSLILIHLTSNGFQIIIKPNTMIESRVDSVLSSRSERPVDKEGWTSSSSS